MLLCDAYAFLFAGHTFASPEQMERQAMLPLVVLGAIELVAAALLLLRRLWRGGRCCVHHRRLLLL